MLIENIPTDLGETRFDSSSFRAVDTNLTEQLCCTDSSLDGSSIKEMCSPEDTRIVFLKLFLSAAI